MTEIKDVMLEIYAVGKELHKEITTKWFKGELAFDPKGHFGFEPNKLIKTGDPAWDRFYRKDKVLFSYWIESAFDLERFMMDPFLDISHEHNLDYKNDEDRQKGLELLRKINKCVVARSYNTVCGECNEPERTSIMYDRELALLYVDGEECSNPGGIKTVEVELDVPSGKIVFANDLRALYPEVKDGHDVNTSIGIVKETKEFEKHGVVFCFVGNTCPGVYQLPNGQVTVGSYYGDPTDPNDEYSGYDEHEYDEYRVGGICTDLWWFCAVDSSDYEKRLAESEFADDRFDVDVVDVTPGKYKITYTFSRGDNYGDTIEYAKFELIK